MKYDKENIDKTISSLEQLLEHMAKQKEKTILLKKELTRISRALDSEFWLKDWAKKTPLEKMRIMHTQATVSFPSSGSPFRDFDDFHFLQKKQWKKDKDRIAQEIKNDSQ